LGWKIITEIKESNIVVAERKDDRILMSDNIIYSRLSKYSIYTRSYWDYFLPLPSLFDEPRILLIGLGGGTIPFQLGKIYGTSRNVDAVELDENMVKASKAFLTESIDANIIVADGASYIKGKKEEYDVIMMDSFKKDNIPDQFISNEFVQNAHSALKRDGILAINYTFSVLGLAREAPYRKKLRRLFNLYTIDLSPTLRNQVFIASKSMLKDEINRIIEAKFPKSHENGFIFDGYKRMKA
jgi:spermidine synthase